MTPGTSILHRFAGTLVARRGSMPTWLLRLVEIPAKAPDSILGRTASVLLGGRRSAPPPTAVPSTPIRVYIAPTNYAGQGWLWARALEAADSRIGARNMALEIPGTFGFPADRLVPVAAQNVAYEWQRQELAAVKRFSHVLVEAERSLFGPLLGRSLDRELELLSDCGVSVAYLAHGTDVRSPRTHMSLTPWSHLRDAPDRERIQRDVDANLEFLARSGRPLFVSTPDLLLDVPTARWCPVVVDPQRWVADRLPGDSGTVVVAHVPSDIGVKGSELIEPALRRLHDGGVIEYRRVHGVPSARMPEIVGSSDMLLDQFRTGSYGVAAVEAMAAGRVVIAHVVREVRDHVRTSTGVPLPIVEATPDTLESVIRDLVADPGRMRMIGDAGSAFVRRVHDGRGSARVLIDAWIDSAL